LLKESDADGDLSQQVSASDEDFDGSSDSDDQRKKKKIRPMIPGERKSTRSRRVAGSMVCHRRLEQMFGICQYSLGFFAVFSLCSYAYCWCIKVS